MPYYTSKKIDNFLYIDLHNLENPEYQEINMTTYKSIVSFVPIVSELELMASAPVEERSYINNLILTEGCTVIENTVYAKRITFKSVFTREELKTFFANISQNNLAHSSEVQDGENEMEKFMEIISNEIGTKLWFDDMTDLMIYTLLINNANFGEFPNSINDMIRNY